MRRSAFDSVRQQQRQLDVAFGGEHGQQVVELKDEADVLRAPARQPAAAERADALAADFDRAAGRRIEPAHQIEQRRLARARRSHQGEEIAARNLEIDALQHVDALAAPRERLVHVRDANERATLGQCRRLPIADAGSPGPSRAHRIDAARSSRDGLESTSTCHGLSPARLLHVDAHAVFESRGNGHDDLFARSETGHHLEPLAVRAAGFDGAPLGQVPVDDEDEGLIVFRADRGLRHEHGRLSRRARLARPARRPRARLEGT